jgi:multidrug efflux pump
VGVLGFSFLDKGKTQVWLCDSQRLQGTEGQGQGAADVAGRAFGAFSGIRDAQVFQLSPPPIRGLGTNSGTTCDCRTALALAEISLAARNQLLGLRQKPDLAQVRPDGLEDAAQLNWTLIGTSQRAGAFEID